MWTLFPTARVWGALLPYTPSGTGCERVAPLSRSPGVVLLKGLFLTKQVILLRTLFPTTRVWGAPLPYIPSGTGCERVWPSRALPGDGLARGRILLAETGVYIERVFWYNRAEYLQTEK